MFQEPQTQAELVEYAADIMRVLISKYHSDGDVFTDLDDKSTGLIYRCAGSLSLLLLVNGFDNLPVKDDWASIVINEFSNVLDHIKNKGFDASPLKPEAVTANIFSPQAGTPYHYVDSVSWVLSFALHIRLADRYQKLVLDQPQRNDVFETVRNCLAHLCEAGMDGGGWGFTRGTTKPDLYYSYAASESLADFGDYVLGESAKEINIVADEELKAFLQKADKDLIATALEKRKLTAKWLWETFKDELGVNEINPGLKVNGNRKSHILLYFTYFVIDMLIVNLPEEFFERDEYFRANRNQIYRKIEHALYLSRIDFDKAYDDVDWWKSWDESSLELLWDTFEDPKLFDPKKIKLSSTQIYEPGFVPLSLRCNALYAFYIAVGPDQKMARLFNVLHENRHQGTGLWDSQSYSLMVTERAIEAVVDYNDYMTRFHVEETIPEPELERPPSLEAAFRQLVKNEVKGCLADSQGASGVVTSGDGASLTEEKLVKKLVSVLATANQHARGSAGDNLPFSKKDMERLDSNFRSFLSNLLFGSLENNVEPAQKDKLRANLDENLKDLFGHLGPWLAFSSKVRLGDLFSHLSEETLMGMESGKGANRPKVAPETKR